MSNPRALYSGYDTGYEYTVDSIIPKWGCDVKVNCSSVDINITIPIADAIPPSKIYIVKTDSTAYKVNVLTMNGETINGMTSISLDREGDYIELFCHSTTEITVSAGNQDLSKIISVLDSTDNSLFATVNNADSNTVDIINSTSIDLDGVSLNTIINGVESNTVSVQPLIASPTANNFVWVDGTGKVIDSLISFVTALGLDNTSVPSSLAVANAIAYAIESGKSYRGGYDASSGLFPSTGGSGTSGEILAGDQFGIIVAGTLGTVPVVYGDSIIAIFDSPGQTQSNWIFHIDKVDSVFGRTGPVVGENGDYNINQITNGLSNIATSSQMLVANGSNILTPRTMSGDVTNDNTGVQMIGANKVTNTKLAQAIARTYKGNNTDGTANILDVAMGNVTEVTSNVLTITGGANSVLNSLTIAVKQATASVSGYLTAADWNTFNNKQPLLSPTNRLDATNVGTGVITNTTFSYLANVTSDIQEQLDESPWTINDTGNAYLNNRAAIFNRDDDNDMLLRIGNTTYPAYNRIDFRNTYYPDFCDRIGCQADQTFVIAHRGLMPFKLVCVDGAQMEFHVDFSCFGGTVDEGVIDGGWGTFNVVNNQEGYRTAHILNTATSPTTAVLYVASKGTTRHNLLNLQYLNLSTVETDAWYIRCSISTGTAGGIRGNGAGVSFQTTSDMRIKNSIVKIDDAYYYNLIQKNPHQTYEFKYNGSDMLQYGFIAQNIREVFPHLVIGEDEDLEKTGDPLNIDYSQVTPILYSALKDAITEIESLKLEIANIKTKLKIK